MFAEINPKDAKRIGIVNGKDVWVHTPEGGPRCAARGRRRDHCGNFKEQVLKHGCMVGIACQPHKHH
jgi:anaerobic selenocysteine-containing dehydrogenase